MKNDQGPLPDDPHPVGRGSSRAVRAAASRRGGVSTGARLNGRFRPTRVGFTASRLHPVDGCRSGNPVLNTLNGEGSVGGRLGGTFGPDSANPVTD